MMELPQELVLALSGLVGVLVAQGLKKIGAKLGVDLGGFAAGATASIVGILVASLNGLFAFVPVEYAGVVRAVLAGLVVLFAPAGIHSYLKK